MENFNLNKINLLRLTGILYIFCFALIPNLWASQEKPIFATWKGFEVDKCASIWLIKNYIDKNAQIKFYSKDEKIKEGILFDTPEAKFRRYFNMSTYESLMRHYKLNDPVLLHIGKIIHDIEVNTWEKKALEETCTIRDAVNKIIWETKETDEVIEKTNLFFNDLYRKYLKRPVPL